MVELKTALAKRGPSLMLLAALAFCLLAVAYIVYLELGPFGRVELQVDELYFYTCGARQSLSALWFNPGCHDNKAPLIYLVQQWVQPSATQYSVLAGKVAAYGVMAMLVAAVGAVAFQLAGVAAAVASVTLLFSALAFSSQLWGLKTEPVGMLLVLGAFWLLTARKPATLLRLGLAGLWLGLAILVKQTNLIYLAMACVWLCWTGRAAASPKPWKRWQAAMLMLVCGCAPFGLYLVGVALEGRADSFLASFFLYPSVYGEGPPRGLQAYLRRFIEVYELVSSGHEVLFWLSVLGAAQTLYFCLSPKAMQDLSALKHSQMEGRLLLVLATACGWFVTLISPNFSFYHAIPIWVGLAVLAGFMFNDIWSALLARRRYEAVMFGLVLAGCSLMALLHVWYHQGGRGQWPAPEAGRPTIEGVQGQYAYVLGMPWPSFYTDNGLIPASDILYPWALPGMPKNFHYTPPPLDSVKGQWLARMQARNLAVLWEDFRRTPPSYIGLVDGWVKAPGSPRFSDVPGFDAYLEANCVYFKTLARERMDGMDKPLVIYKCNGG